MRISIITVCFNSEATIRKTIESVLAQSYTEIEYIIVDGASKDNTVAVAREYESHCQEKGYAYRIISEKDKGIYDAMNKGIRMATGEIIGIVNSDDWFEPHTVETVAKVYEETGFDMFYADLNLVKDNGTIIVKHSKMDKFPTTRHWNHPTTFITRKTYEEVGAFRCVGLYDDFDLMLRIRRANKKVVIRNEVLSNFRTGGVSTQKSFKKAYGRFLDRYRCYRDNGYSSLYIFECIAMELAKLVLS